MFEIVACKNPLLRKANIKKRLQLARDHVNWTETEWSKVLFTDETKIEIFGSHRRVFIRRMSGERYKSECLIPTVKHGRGSIMVWGAVLCEGALPLHLIEGIMKKESYHQILIRRVMKHFFTICSIHYLNNHCIIKRFQADLNCWEKASCFKRATILNTHQIFAEAI